MSEEYDDWVERLDLHARQRVEWMNQRITELTNGWQAADAENARLRAALEEIAEGCGHARCHAYPWMRTARKALGERR